MDYGLQDLPSNCMILHSCIDLIMVSEVERHHGQFGKLLLIALFTVWLLSALPSSASYEKRQAKQIFLNNAARYIGYVLPTCSYLHVGFDDVKRHESHPDRG